MAAGLCWVARSEVEAPCCCCCAALESAAPIVCSQLSALLPFACRGLVCLLQACCWAWELSTKVFGLPVERLWVGGRHTGSSSSRDISLLVHTQTHIQSAAAASP